MSTPVHSFGPVANTVASSSNPSRSQVRVSPCLNVTPIVYVVDDDISGRDSLERLIRCEGWQAETFESAQELMDRPRALVPSCLLLALSPPDPNGLEVQKWISQERPEMPIVVVCGRGDIRTTVEAMKAGAVDVLVKPSRSEILLGAIRQGLELSRATVRQEVAVQALRESYASLSSRERQVMTLVVQGQLNKLIAADLGIVEITVKSHRRRVMRKMGAKSLPALVRMAAALGLSEPMPRKAGPVETPKCYSSTGSARISKFDMPALAPA